VFEARRFLDKLPFFVEQPLFEAFRVHGILSIRISNEQLLRHFETISSPSIHVASPKWL